MHRVPVSLVLLIAAAAASTANMPMHKQTISSTTRQQQQEDNTDKISSTLEIINPWLSACDLAQPATAPDLQGTCSTATPVPATNMWIDEGPGPPERDKSRKVPIPPCSPSSSSAPRNASTTSNQCLYYLEESHKMMVCDKGLTRAARQKRIAELRLKHCSEHKLYESLSDHLLEDILNGGAKCRYAITAMLDTDALAARITCEFTEVLIRYDCGQPYSIVYNCDECKDAYRRWVCSSLLPYFTNRTSTESSNSTISSTSTSRTTRSKSTTAADGKTNNIRNIGRRRVRPCRSVCQTVEQRCPYMLPGDRAPAHPTQYAGEPTFICLDPNIPETGEQLLKSSYGDEDCCYTYCNSGNICAQCLTTAKPDVATILEESSWRVRCTTAPSSSTSGSNDMRASNCPSKSTQSGSVVIVVTAQQDDNTDSSAHDQIENEPTLHHHHHTSSSTSSHAHNTYKSIQIIAVILLFCCTNKLLVLNSVNQLFGFFKIIVQQVKPHQQQHSKHLTNFGEKWKSEHSEQFVIVVAPINNSIIKMASECS